MKRDSRGGWQIRFRFSWKSKDEDGQVVVRLGLLAVVDFAAVERRPLLRWLLRHRRRARWPLAKCLGSPATELLGTNESVAVAVQWVAEAIQKPRGTVAEAIGADTITNDRLEMAELMTTSARRDERAGASASAAETALRSCHCWPDIG